MAIPLNKLILSRYMVYRHIASGGMADIYEADDVIIDKPVALKFLKTKSLENDYEVELFKNEARYLAMFNHPHIMKIYNVDEFERQPFVSYELLKGKTLKEVLDNRGKLSLDESLDFMCQILDGVSEIHNKEVVHNDLKPDNLLLLSDGTIKIVDFGIASHVFSKENRETLGSVSYVAPEVLTNKKYSYQSDIYSLGIILFEFLTGKLPFSGTTSKEILKNKIEKDIPSIRAYINLPNYEDIDYVLQKALNKYPSNRYKNCKEFMNNINALKRHEKLKKESFFSRLFH